MESLLRRVVLYLRIPVGMIALAGLLISGLVHAASLPGIDIESAWPSVWVLHYALYPIIVLAVLTAGVVAGQKRLGFRAFLELVPAPAWIVLAAAFVYAVATFLIFTPLSGAGDPVIVDGRFFFNDHGGSADAFMSTRPRWDPSLSVRTSLLSNFFSNFLVLCRP